MNYTVLLLDDDALFRRMVVPGLTGKGIVVVESATGEDATRVLKDNNFDLLIIDGVLPDTDGIQWITKYKKSGGHAPVIFISGHWQSTEIYQTLTRELEVSQIIHKPVIPQVFAEQIFAEISKEGVASSAAVPAKEEQLISNEENVIGSLAELSREYLKELPGELEKIRLCLEQAKADTNQREQFGKLRLLSHKLRGTAGSFGLTAIGELMGNIEDKIRVHEPDFKKLPAGFYSDLEEFLKQAQKLEKDANTIKQTSSLTKDRATENRSASRILVIADDQEFLSSVDKVARQRLIDMQKASSVEEVMELLSSKSVDAILIDINPDEQKSFELIRAIRESTSEAVPIAFISGETELVDRLLAAHLGASLYLNKPIDPDTLEDAIQRLMILSSRERPKILIVDDDIHFSRRVARVLMDKGMQTQMLNDPMNILEKLQEFNPDILILDLMMPYISGFDICKMLRTTPRWQDLPIIFVTAQTGIETRIAAFSCGADDYCPKPLANDELIARVNLRVERSRLLKERSERDPLTGLLVRRGFMDRFNAALGAARRHNQVVSLVLFDLDKFKSINDNYGHLAGDAVLAGLGRLMLKRFRVEDIRGRWGGDEFILAFLGTDKREAHRLMESFLKEYSQIEFCGEHGEIFHASLSAGIATYPGDPDNTYDLLKVADQRLYEAKSLGRNCVVSEINSSKEEAKQ